ncbi:MAG: hypothetical protein ACT4NY_04835 [Pseudonocardiales bacterium]
MEILNPADAKSIGHVNRFLGDTLWQEHFTPIQGEGDEERATSVALRVAELFRKNICALTGYKG